MPATLDSKYAVLGYLAIDELKVLNNPTLPPPCEDVTRKYLASTGHGGLVGDPYAFKNKNNKEKYMTADLPIVTKRDGSKEPLDIEKIHQVLFWATEGITGVSVSDIEMKAKIQFYDGIATRDIHGMLVQAAADLIDENNTNYQYVAARLMLFNLRKEVLGQFDPIPLRTFVELNVSRGLYDAAIFDYYNDEDFKKLEKIVKHDRDMNFTYAAMKQLQGKYLMQQRNTGKIYETPQYAYIMIAATMFATYPEETRMRYVKDFYNQVSLGDSTLPTPIMAGVRTPDRQYSSCVLIETDDSLDSIIATAGSIVKYISNKAGIGIGAGRIRAEGSQIRNGQSVHTGVTPFFRFFQSAVKSCSQGGVRGGAATLYVPLWHAEIEDILVLKNNKGTEDNRVRRLDYGIQLNKLMYARFIKGGHITLFSPHDVPDLYEAFFEDQEEFERLYVKYENDRKTPKTKVPASTLFASLMTERAETGRIYTMNVDHANTHSSFTVPIRMSNLCCEIDLPTKPLKSLDDPDGEISLCTLSAINLGTINLNNLEDIERRCDLIVRSLDQLIDYQDYPVVAAEKSTKARRPLGVGVVNYAYYLAKNGYKYSDPGALRFTHETFEALSYYLIKASVELAKEKGRCEWFHETKYAQGLLPIDTYKKDVDTLCDSTLNLDWDTLRAEIAEHGMRNSTLMAIMPAETSAQIVNATNGIEPPRGIVTVKGSKNANAPQVVPEPVKLRNKYEFQFDMPSNDGYIKLTCIMQKFMDQGISVNTYYQPSRYPDKKVPMSEMQGDLLTMYKYGVKQAYYHNTDDNSSDGADEEPTPLADLNPEDEECPSCVL
jgi:ribonucleoside-diphosphate reductase alpha chain